MHMPKSSLLFGLLGLVLKFLVDHSQGGEEVSGKEDEEGKAAHQHLAGGRGSVKRLSKHRETESVKIGKWLGWGGGGGRETFPFIFGN